VDIFSWPPLEADAKKDQSFKALSGIGEAAYVKVDTVEKMAGVYARGGRHTVTVRIEISPAFPTDTADKARTAAIAPAHALLGKLR
jgi:hypothetical protein